MSDMKDRFIFEFQRPKDGIFVSAYVHELYNYRYHWHDTDFEVDILLNGKAEYCHGQQTSLLEAGDVIVIDPCKWHASFAREQGSRALVIRFSDKAYRALLKKDERIAFDIAPSDASSRDNEFYRSIRRYCAMFLLSASEKGDIFQNMKMRAAIEMLMTSISSCGSYQIIKAAGENERNTETMQRIIRYIDEHYNEKLSLQDIGDYAQYNRTYISTLFKNTMGINFYEYLTRTRLSHAIFQLAVTNKTITQISMDCGFPELKTFNQRFKEIFHYLPTEYRQRIDPEHIINILNKQVFLSPELPAIRQILKQYVS